MAPPPASPPQQPQPPPQQPTVLGWLQQLPPWLPPLLWLAGGGTLGAGGLEFMGHQRPPQPQDECVEQQLQLEAITAQLIDQNKFCNTTDKSTSTTKST